MGEGGVGWCGTGTTWVQVRKGSRDKYENILEDEAWWSPVRYTVNNFWFKEEGAVLGDANEFVNHSRVLGIARGRNGGTERKERDERQVLGGHGGGSLLGVQDNQGSLFIFRTKQSRMTHKANHN